jgi:hypothetical protein
VKGLELDWTEKMLARVREVTAEQMVEAIEELMLPIFEPGKSNIVITCAPTMSEVRKALLTCLCQKLYLMMANT